MNTYMEISERLKDARLKAGFRSAAEAAERFGWVSSTYSSHENGTRGVKPDDVKKYALAFRSDPCYLLFGTERGTAKIADVPEEVLREILKFVLTHDGIKKATAEQISDLVLELCHHVSRSGSGGLAQIVDFSLARLDRQAG